LSGGEVHHQDPLSHERGLVLLWCMWLSRGSSLLTDELASSLHRLMLSGVLLITGLHLLPSRMSVRCTTVRLHSGRGGIVVKAYVAGAFSIHGVIVAVASKAQCCAS
jgi:hypothetical protein